MDMHSIIGVLIVVGILVCCSIIVDACASLIQCDTSDQCIGTNENDQMRGYSNTNTIFGGRCDGIKEIVFEKGFLRLRKDY